MSPRPDENTHGSSSGGAGERAYCQTTHRSHRKTGSLTKGLPAVKFGFPIPTCREGRDNLTGLIGPEVLIQFAQEDERLGFDSGWANDYISAPLASVEKFQPPPHWFEILMSLCAIAVKTKKIELGAALIVMPLREPVIFAKQAIITLDHFSNGRLRLGIGLGDIREEFESIKPRESKAHRGKMLDEGLAAVSQLLTQEEVSFNGEYYTFKDVALYPRPVQHPIPIYIAGHSKTTPERIAKFADGWLVSYSNLKQFKESWRAVEQAMARHGRSISELDVTTTWGMRLGKSYKQALSQYENSLQEKLKTSGPPGPRPTEWYRDHNLIGSPAEVAEFIIDFQQAGATHCVPLHIAADSLIEIKEQLQMFAEEVIPLVRSAQ